MGSIKVRNKQINADIRDILIKLKNDLTSYNINKLGIIDTSQSDEISICCPAHKNGQERHPSCGIYIGPETDKKHYGSFHCFTCGEGGSFVHFVALCFNQDDRFAEDWLLSNYTSTEITYKDIQNIVLQDNYKATKREISLNEYVSYHPYMEKRKLKRSICERFKVCYDPKEQCIVFPVSNEYGKLIFITKRSVNTKFYHIGKDANKCIYCLDYILKNNIKEVVVCESQINCLYAWSLGYPAIALFGTGSYEQYKLLKASGILHYVLCLDGDDAGRKGVERFIRNVNSGFVDAITMSEDKDLNDLNELEASLKLSQFMKKYE